MSVKLLGGTLHATCINCGYEATTGNLSPAATSWQYDLSVDPYPIEISETGEEKEGPRSVVQLLQNDGWKVDAVIKIDCTCPQCYAKQQADAEAERMAAEKVEADRIEAERVEAVRIEAERVEAERVEAEHVETSASEQPVADASANVIDNE